jgi:hypothetical protein
VREGILSALGPRRDELRNAFHVTVFGSFVPCRHFNFVDKRFHAP